MAAMIGKLLSLLIVLALAGVLPGCNLFAPAPPRLTGTGMDMFGPVAMRLHPLSRIVLAPPLFAATTAPATAPAAAPRALPPGSPLVEARMELTDQFGDTGKGVGDLTLELYAYSVLGLDRRGDRIDRWSFDLSTPERNIRAWDAITRTYVFKLPVPREAFKDAKHMVLVARLALPNGGMLTDQRVLEVK